MVFGRRRGPAPTLGVVVPAYDVADYLPACLDSILGQTARPSSTSWSSTTGRPTPRARSPSSTPPATRGSGSCTSTTAGLGAARNEGLRHVRRRLRRVRRLRRRRPADGVRRARRLPGADRLGPRRPARSCAGRTAPSPSRRGCAGCTTRPAPTSSILDHPELLGDVFAWNKVYRRSFWDGHGAGLARGGPLRGPADDHPRLPRRRRDRRPGRRRLPLADPARRHLDHPAARLAAGPRGPVGDQADGAGERRRVRRRRRDDPRAAMLREVFVDRVLAGDLHRYFTEIPGCDDAWWDLLRERDRRAVGRPLADPQRAAPRRTGSSAGWSSRTAARTRPP